MEGLFGWEETMGEWKWESPQGAHVILIPKDRKTGISFPFTFNFNFSGLSAFFLRQWNLVLKGRYSFVVAVRESISLHKFLSPKHIVFQFSRFMP